MVKAKGLQKLKACQQCVVCPVSHRLLTGGSPVPVRVRPPSSRQPYYNILIDKAIWPFPLPVARAGSLFAIQEKVVDFGVGKLYSK